MVSILKCPTCSFECVSSSLLERHSVRCASGVSEYEERKAIKRKQWEAEKKLRSQKNS